MKSLYSIATAFMAFCFIPASALADDATTKQESRSYNCHYEGGKKTDDMTATITKDGDKFTWNDDAGESGPLTILPDHVIAFDYTYTGKDEDTQESGEVSGRMTFKVLDNGTLDGTYTDGYDSGKITCTERKE